ncbi:dTDP-4-dehydrorhamnose reductase [Shewanella sp. UCD-KL21]|uniref:SDR family oxidoreductase n=1 Tax=Shewanella sp. UCD-KL21 TaxID=1917164 RepID=UPI00097090BC|nr:dTDP-4-dehydrorhamnose reductase [Shewanella sp. UCD-KL21]
MKLLLTGANGQLGLSIRGCVADHNAFLATNNDNNHRNISSFLNTDLSSQYMPNELQLLTADKSDLEISDANAVMEMIDRLKPDLIINCAAYTQVDLAETHQQLADDVNATGAKNLALAALKASIPLIHISTDYVFDGKSGWQSSSAVNSTLSIDEPKLAGGLDCAFEKSLEAALKTSPSPYPETAVPNPLNRYGASKWRGEQCITDILPQHIIIRTSWLISEFGHNFAKTVIRLAKTKPTLTMVADQAGCPTYAGDLAKAILNIAAQIQQGKTVWGTFHYCGDTAISWYGLAKAIVDEASMQGKLLTVPTLKGIDTDDYPLPAKRPSYSVLDCQQIKMAWGIDTCDWQASIKTLVNNLDVDAL